MNTLKMDRNQLIEGVTQERIQARAYELYLARGDGAGDEQQDWLRAERELTEAALAAPSEPDETEPTSKKNQRENARSQRGSTSNGQRPSQRH